MMKVGTGPTVDENLLVSVQQNFFGEDSIGMDSDTVPKIKKYFYFYFELQLRLKNWKK